MFEEMFCILKKGWREKEFVGIQTALLGKASLCYLEPAAFFEFQPWQSASQKLNERTHPLNAVGPLVVDDFDGAKLELNHLARHSALCPATAARGCPPRYPPKYPRGHSEQPTPCPSLSLAELYLGSSRGLCPSAPATAASSHRHGVTRQPALTSGAWGCCCQRGGLFFLKTRAKSCWWANCPNGNWAGHCRTLLSLITDWCLLEMGWYSSTF